MRWNRPETLCGDVRIRSQTIGNGRLREPLEFPTPLIIGVEDAHFWSARAGPRKQPFLCREVVFKGLVIVHVLAGQVGKDRRLEMAAPQAIHGQGM